MAEAPDGTPAGNDGLPNPAAAGTSPPDPMLVKGTPEYQARMQAIGSGKPDPAGELGDLTPTDDITTTGATAKAKPDWVPDKFWDSERGEVKTEAMAKSYAALETKQGAGDKPGDGKPPTMDTPKITDESTFDDIAKAAGVDPTEVAKLFVEGDGLDDATYQAISKVMPNVPKGIMNAALRAQFDQALGSLQKINTMSIEKAGGEDRLNNLLTWGLSNLPSEDVEWYNAAVSGNDIKAAERAVDWLMSKHSAAVGSGDATPIEGTGSSTTSPASFTNDAELGAAMSDKRYAPTLPNGVPNPDYDPAYRGSVLRRMHKYVQSGSAGSPIG